MVGRDVERLERVVSGIEETEIRQLLDVERLNLVAAYVKMLDERIGRKVELRDRVLRQHKTP